MQRHRLLSVATSPTAVPCSQLLRQPVRDFVPVLSSSSPVVVIFSPRGSLSLSLSLSLSAVPVSFVICCSCLLRHRCTLVPINERNPLFDRTDACAQAICYTFGFSWLARAQGQNFLDMDVQLRNMRKTGSSTNKEGTTKSACSSIHVCDRRQRESVNNEGRQAMRKFTSKGSSASPSGSLAKRTLCSLLSLQYVDLAFDLPHSSDGIWHIIQKDVICLASGAKEKHDREHLLSFLQLFFSLALVEKVSQNLDLLSNSFLGLDYTLRVGKAALALRILDDVMTEHVIQDGGPLSGFHGDIATDGSEMEGMEAMQEGEWKDVRKKGKTTRYQHPGGSTRSTHQGRGQGRGGGRGGRGGRGGPTIDYVEEEEEEQDRLKHAEVVEVLLPAYKTPPKAPRESDEQKQRVLSITERSRLFHDHVNVTEGFPYDPFENVDGGVRLYHGTRASSLPSFRAKGINPPAKTGIGNEFSADEAFYLTNSLRHAYERPLHAHPSGDMIDPVAVMVFDVDTKLLHGEALLEETHTPFNVLWFEDANDTWANFCAQNMRRESKPHKHDIVIGPVCIPRPKPLKYIAQTVDLDGGAQLTQVAFCTQRSMIWIEPCLTCIYLEARSASPAQASEVCCSDS